MKRRTFFKASALVSLCFCGLTCWWWYHSIDRVDELAYDGHGQHAVRLWGSGGKVRLTRTVYTGSAESNTSLVSWTSSPLDSSSANEANKITLLSVWYNNEPVSTFGKSGEVSTLVVPAWLIAGVFVVPAGIWATARMNRKKEAKRIANDD
ncbi:MAG TPA: hypothetical protein VH518_16340 [Tepidisphaeraceae bacterium]